jgi:hypothetical protein
MKKQKIIATFEAVDIQKQLNTAKRKRRNSKE